MSSTAAAHAFDLAPAGDFSLSPEQVEQFHTDGFLGPFAACPPEQMDAMRPEIEAILDTDPPDHQIRHHNRHLDQQLIWDLSTAPNIIHRMRSIYGPDLLMWRTNFFNKGPGGKEIPWHQDYNYWPLEPSVIISAWVAIDPATTENSCVQLIPGSHRSILPHVKCGPEKQFTEEADPNFVDASKAVNMELKPGEFFLFNERTLHHSHPNTSDKNRNGMAIRVIVPLVRVLSFDSPRHRLIQICGEDPMGFNEKVDPPTA